MDGQLVQSVANALSTITILSCLFMKVPQIISIKEKQSAEGIYIQAMLMEIMGFTIMTLYNFTNHYSVLTYMEYPIILLQVYVMLYYVLKYKKLLGCPALPLSSAAYFITVALFATQVLPSYLLSFVVPLCTPLSGFAKVTYMYGIIKAANADTVSMTTWTISVCTNVSRLFTVYVDSADKRLLFNFIISALLSSGVLATAVYYKRKTTSAGAKQRRRSQSNERKRPHDE